VRGTVEVSADPGAAAAELLSQAAASHGHIALTGGSTPARAYELAAQAGGDWSHATLWFGDDRCVPPDDERSNYGMAKATLLDRLPEPHPTVHRIEGERGPQEGADDYEAKLRDTFGAGMPSLDLVLLGRPHRLAVPWQARA
jgi:6-phosphogluconolactonase